MPPPELSKYIETQRAAGDSPEQIFAALVTGGWQDDAIRTAFTSLGIVLPKPGSVPPNTAPLQVSQKSFIEDQALFDENIDNIQSGTHAYIWAHHRVSYIVVWILSASLSGLMCIPVFIYGTQTKSPDLRIFILPFLPLFGFPGLFFSYYRRKIEDIFWHQVATSLGFSYISTGDTTTLTGRGLASSGNGLLVNDTQIDTQISNVLSGSYDGNGVRIFKFGRLIHANKGSHWSFETVFEFESSTTLPDMILRPLQARTPQNGPRLSEAVTLSVIPSGYETLALEGNFNKYFQLIIPIGAQIDALQIFQPDIMAAFIDTYTSIGVEFIDKKFYIYPLQLIGTKEEIRTLLSLAEKLYQQVLPILNEMHVSTEVGGGVAVAQT